MNVQTTDYRQLNDDYACVEQAIRYLEHHLQDQPELSEVAAAVGLSEFHFQRLFSRWVGISPKRFLQFLTKEGAKELLERSSVLETTLAVGLSSPGRLHDLMVTTEAVTPGQFKLRGKGLTIRYGFHPTPFGECLIGTTDRGICHLGFVQSTEGDALDQLMANWQSADLVEDQTATAVFVEPIFDLGIHPHAPLPIYLSGTNFQLKVWEALLSVPPGNVTTYEAIASRIGHPSALRAVGTAVGHNPVPVLIPCHRVIRKPGEFGNYRYGVERKKALIGWEASALQGA